MEKVKKIKIKQSDGSYGQEIPIGVDAKDVDLANGASLEDAMITTDDIIDNVATYSTNQPLSANMGRWLNENKANKNEIHNITKATSQKIGGIKAHPTTGSETVEVKINSQGFLFVPTSIDGGSSGGTTDYNALSNKPYINNVELKGRLTTAQLGIKDGKTPAKGVDYYTESEKQQFVQDVIAELPKWTGGAY